MKKSGFTLVELLIYVALLAWLSHLLFSFAADVALHLSSDGRGITQQAQALMSFDLLVRDIRRAPCEVTAWKKITPLELIWHDAVKNKDCSWTVAGGRLLRSTGLYDVDTHAWVSRRRELMAQGVERVEYDLIIDHASVTGVRIELVVQGEKKSYRLQQWVTVRERLI